MKVAIIFDGKGPMAITDTHIAQVQTALPDAEVKLSSSSQALIDAHFIAEDYCQYASNLKWIHGLASGVEGLLSSSVANLPGIRITSSKGIHGIPMSNHVMGYILAFLRRFPEFWSNQTEQKWVRPMPDEATGKVLTIIGLGNIGKSIAKVAKAFDMTVYGVKRHISSVEYVDRVYSEEQLPSVLGLSDFVIMLLPANDSTYHFMNQERFSMMKPGSYFINVGRGQTVDESALLSALQSGLLAGAALDVADPEPIPAHNPLWRMSNVLITPHVAADSPRYMDRAFGVFQTNVPHFLTGESMQSEVDLEARY